MEAAAVRVHAKHRGTERFTRRVTGKRAFHRRDAIAHAERPTDVGLAEYDGRPRVQLQSAVDSHGPILLSQLNQRNVTGRYHLSRAKRRLQRDSPVRSAVRRWAEARIPTESVTRGDAWDSGSDS